MPRKIITIFVILSVVSVVAVFLSQERNYILGNNPDLEQKKQPEDFAFLLFGQVGQSQGGKWHFSPDLADAIILIYYQLREGSLTDLPARVINLISLPRDLYGNFDDSGEPFKINEIVKRDKVQNLLRKLPEITGIKTDNFLILDLGVVKKIIDGLGGIDVELKSDVIDSVNGREMKIGPRHLSGEDAVWLIRNRFAPEGDFFREKNQHLIIEAIFRRYQELSQLERIKFFFRLSPEISRIKTNINLSELFYKTQKVQNTEFRGIVLDFSAGLLESATSTIGDSTVYILFPKLGRNNYAEIRDFIGNKIK